MSDSSMKFLINGESYELDIEKLTFAEARAFETHSGISFMDTLENPQLRTGIDALQAIVWIAVKRKEPTKKFGDLDDVEIGSIVADEPDEADGESEPDGEADPTPAEEETDDAEPEPRVANAAVS